MQHRCIHLIGHFTVVYLVAKPLIWSEAEGDLDVIDLHLKNSKVCAKQGHLNSLTPIKTLGNQACNCKMNYLLNALPICASSPTGI